MLKRTLIFLVLALTQTGCSIEEGDGAYDPVSLTDESGQGVERDKRESLNIEDMKLGDGPLALMKPQNNERHARTAVWRRRAGSNRCIAVLQTAPLTTWVRRPARIIAGLVPLSQRTL